MATKDIKSWNDNCPKCNGKIKWSLNSSRSGSKSNAYCSNSLISSGVFKALSDIIGCDWTGYAIRQRDSSVRFANKDGRFILE